MYSLYKGKFNDLRKDLVQKNIKTMPCSEKLITIQLIFTSISTGFDSVNSSCFFNKSFCGMKKRSTFAPVLERCRVVECGGLENHCTARYRGFESLSLRILFLKHGVAQLVEHCLQNQVSEFESLLPCRAAIFYKVAAFL